MKMNTNNLTAKDLFNAKSASIAVQKAPETLTVHSAALDQITDTDTGEIKTVAYLFATDGKVYGSISQTICDNIPDLIDYINDAAGAVDIAVNRSTSNSGREYLTLTIL